MEKAKYKAIGNIRFDGKRFTPGSVLELTEAEAKVFSGYITPVSEAIEGQESAQNQSVNVEGQQGQISPNEGQESAQNQSGNVDGLNPVFSSSVEVQQPQIQNNVLDQAQI